MLCCVASVVLGGVRNESCSSAQRPPVPRCPVARVVRHARHDGGHLVGRQSARQPFADDVSDSSAPVSQLVHQWTSGAAGAGRLFLRAADRVRETHGWWRRCSLTTFMASDKRLFSKKPFFEPYTYVETNNTFGFTRPVCLPAIVLPALVATRHPLMRRAPANACAARS